MNLRRPKSWPHGNINQEEIMPRVCMNLMNTLEQPTPAFISKSRLIIVGFSFFFSTSLCLLDNFTEAEVTLFFRANQSPLGLTKRQYSSFRKLIFTSSNDSLIKRYCFSSSNSGGREMMTLLLELDWICSLLRQESDKDVTQSQKDIRELASDVIFDFKGNSW